MTKYRLKADRYVDQFHIIKWATDALDEVRLDAWRRARIALAELMKHNRRPQRKEAKYKIKKVNKDVKKLKRFK